MNTKTPLLQCLMLLSTLFFTTLSNNAKALSAGDIVVIGIAGDVSGDEISWLPLIDLSAGEVIYFTNARYNTFEGGYCNSSSEANDFLLRYTVPAGGVTAGTVFTISGSPAGDYAFVSGTKFGAGTAITVNTAGDACTIFQSTDAEDANFGNTSFTPIFSVTSMTTNWASYTGGCTGSGSFGRHNLVAGLTDGTNALAAGAGSSDDNERDNIKYTGTTTGDRDALLAAISNAANWTGTNADATSASYTTNGVATGPGGFNVLADMPVELISFNANTQTDRVVLNWITATELNNKGFDIEKSSNSTDWEKVGFVNGAGTTLESQNYNYTDFTPSSGVNYYRLKQVDFDGQYEYSQIVATQMAAKRGRLNVFPTLATNILNVSMEGTATLRIINLEGQILKQFSLSDSAVLDISDLAEGMYLLSMESGEKMESVRFVKQ